MINAARIRQISRLFRHAGLPVIALGVSTFIGAGINHFVRPVLAQMHDSSLAAAELMAVEPVRSPFGAQDAMQPAALAATPAPAVWPEPAVAASVTPVPVQVAVNQVPPAPAALPVEPPRHAAPALPPSYRFFNGRVIRPARTLTMVTTAYSPDERSCGPDANGTTASGKSVWTNGMKMAAADTRLLPFGSIISVPGYYNGQPVPVLDRGGAIKGHRLDMLYPSHEMAVQWGRKRQQITVWEYVK